MTPAMILVLGLVLGSWWQDKTKDDHNKSMNIKINNKYIVINRRKNILWNDYVSLDMTQMAKNKMRE